MNDYQDVIEQLKRRNPQAIILFGSYAWGNPHQDSDLDIVVVEESRKSHIDRMRELRSYVRSNKAIDIIGLTPAEANLYRTKYSFYKKIFDEGKVLYGRI
jgi:predicted nucleotidyltransferase